MSSVIAHGTPVTWKSRAGYTFEGTVEAGPDDDGNYEVVRDDNARGTVAGDALTLKGEPGDPEPEVTAAQRAALRNERGRLHANSRVVDAMQSTFVTMREDLKRELGEEPEGAALDDVRLHAADIVVQEATDMRASLRRGIEAKR